MNLLNPALLRRIQADIVRLLSEENFDQAGIEIEQVLASLYDRIPENKRISYGRVYTIKVLTQELFCVLGSTSGGALLPAAGLFDASTSWQVKGTALGVLSYCGLKEPLRVLPYFEAAAVLELWELRELTQMLFRKLIKAHPKEMKAFLIKLSKSNNSNLRRFAAETLRPVQENRWFYKQPEYPLSVLRRMFAESAPYPRTAVGNNLSDLARRLPDLVYDLVKELVASGNNNAYWIATRACRNLVKVDPDRVLDLLQTDVYRYKDRVYRRQGTRK